MAVIIYSFFVEILIINKMINERSVRSELKIDDSSNKSLSINYSKEISNGNGLLEKLEVNPNKKLLPRC